MSAKDNSKMDIYFHTSYRDRGRDFQGNLFSGMRLLQRTSSYGVQQHNKWIEVHIWHDKQRLEKFTIYCQAEAVVPGHQCLALIEGELLHVVDQQGIQATFADKGTGAASKPYSVQVPLIIFLVLWKLRSIA